MSFRGWWRWRRFLFERRNLEYELWQMNAPKWYQVKHDNEVFGVWGKHAQERVELH